MLYDSIYEVSKVVNLSETENRTVVTRDWEEAEMEVFRGYRGPTFQDEKVLQICFIMTQVTTELYIKVSYCHFVFLLRPQFK